MHVIISFDSRDSFSWSIFSHDSFTQFSYFHDCFIRFMILMIHIFTQFIHPINLLSYVSFAQFILLSFVMLGVVQWLRHWISVWKVVDSNPVTIGPLSKALNPQLSSLINEINASFIYSYVILYTDLFSQVILSWFMSLWFLTMH